MGGERYSAGGVVGVREGKEGGGEEKEGKRRGGGRIGWRRAIAVNRNTMVG